MFLFIKYGNRLEEKIMIRVFPCSRACGNMYIFTQMSYLYNHDLSPKSTYTLYLLRIFYFLVCCVRDAVYVCNVYLTNFAVNRLNNTCLDLLQYVTID